VILDIITYCRSTTFAPWYRVC